MKKNIKEAIRLRIPNIPQFDLDKICNDFEKFGNGFLYVTEDFMTHEGKYTITDSTLEDVALYLFKLSLENLDLFIHCLIQKEGNEYYSIPVANIKDGGASCYLCMDEQRKLGAEEVIKRLKEKISEELDKLI